jgi:hypothetical protein
MRARVFAWLCNLAGRVSGLGYNLGYHAERAELWAARRR